MKVKTDQAEACRSQIRTEIKKTVAQMIALNQKSGKASRLSGQSTTALRAGSFLTAGNHLARRTAMLLISILLMGVGNVWGKETVLWSGSSTSEVTISLDKFSSAKVGSILRFYMDGTGNIWLHKPGGWDDMLGGTIYYSSSPYEIELDLDKMNAITTNNGVAVTAQSGATLTKVTIYSEDAFINGPRTGCSTLSLPISVSSGTETYTLTKPDNWPSIEAKYVRWYVANGDDVYDITDSEATKPHLTGLTDFTTDADHGSYWHSSTATSSSDLAFPTLTIPSGKSIEDYQVIAILSTEEGTTSSSDLTKEPLYDVVYTFSFELPFKGDATSATAVAKSYQLTESKKSETLTLAFDFASNKIKLLDGSDNEIGSEDMDGSWSSISSGGTLNSEQPFYVRWFLEKAGAETYIADAVKDAGSSYSVPAKERYGLYYQSDGGASLGDVMKIKLDGSKLSNLTDYSLVCTIATDLDGEIFDDSKLTHEPNTMAMKYTISFEDAEWAGTIAVDAKTHSKEVLIPTASTTEIDVPLSDSFTKILSENGSRTPTGLAHDPNEFHIRWYVEKSDGSNYIAISNPEDLLSTVTVSNEGNATQRHKTKAGYGIYWSSLTNYDASNNHYNPIAGDATSNKSTDDVKKLLNIHFTKPSADKWSEYRLVAVMTKDLTGAVASPTTGERELDKEPETLDIVYYFKFFVEDEFQFVHDKGASGRDYITAADDSRIAGTVQQYNWDNDTSTKETVSGDVRQGVHTVEYDIYVDPSSNTPVALHLPFEKYNESGNNLEPTAYIRWYDWATDMNNSKLAPVGTYLENMSETVGSRGLFMLNNSKHGILPTHGLVGVTFNPHGITNTVTIACDVSKYYDGIYQSSVDDDRTDFSGLKKPYLMHEPTLSTRYLINIHPASDVVGQIKAGQIQYEAKGSNMFDAIYENNGRVCVSIKDRNTKFAVRAQLVSLSDYYVYDASNNIVNGSKITWKAFYEDETGYWERGAALIANGDRRIVDFMVSDLDGTYTKVGGSDTKSLTADAGMRFHFVGLIGDGTTMAPVVHYEINLFSAPAYHMDSRPLERTEEYLKEHMDLQATLDFDSYLGLTNDIASQSVNHTSEPLPWGEAQYGFCYPQIDEYRIYTDATRDYSGISPIHGDYMLLKSISVAGVSDNDKTYDYKYHWWAEEPLLDYTYLHGSENKGKYGTFLYVDASDESRTIAKLKFNANLCAGSELCFTAAIANMTHNVIDPQVMATVYAVQKGTGKRVRVVSFLSSELNTTLVKVSPIHDTYTQGSWFQFYGDIIIPDDDVIKTAISASNLDHYEVDIDNYALNTNGADYCVDQLQFYTSTGKLKVEQTGGACEGENLSLTTYIAAEQLESKMTLPETNPKTIYYRIFRKTGTTSSGQILYEPYPDASIYDNSGKNYGQVNVYKYVLASNGTLDATLPRNAGYYIGTDGILYFKVVDDKVFNLEQGYEYFFSLTESLENPDVNYWGDPNDPCDVFSNLFVPKKTYVSFTDGSGNDASTTISSSCSGTASQLVNYTITVSVPDENEASGFKTIPSLQFDFFKGTYAELQSGGAWDGLITALQAYRDYETNNSIPYKNYLHEDFKNYNESYYNILKSAIEADKLEMSASTTFQRTITETTDFLAIPVKRTVDGSDICSVIPFTFTVNASASMPTLTLGFDDVDYSLAGTKRVLRVGLEQLNKMRRSSPDNYILHIPVNGFKDKNQEMTNKLYFPADAYLTISAVDKSASPAVPNTTDPTLPAVGTKFAKIVPNSSSDTRPSVDKDHMYISLDLSGDNCAIDFHEGYEYEVATTFVDATDEGDSDACIGDLFLVIKVVPEFVTWHAQPVGADGKTSATETGYWSANWYNDDNWKRSTRAELYKGAKGSGQNSETAGHPDGYDNNGEGTLDDLTEGSNPGFVPMKFTYVTLPGGNHAPSLINEPRVVREGVGSRRQGGGFLDLDQTKLLTDRSPRDPDGTANENKTNSKPTDNIYYDMLVRYSYSETDEFGEGCFGHRYIKDDGSWADQGTEDLTAKVFDVEKFQGNICNEIYFKPGAELLRQQRLTYKRAWVETEMYANKWYLLASPLQCTYAGDMYVPASMTDVTSGQDVKGRQVTEAFQPITFNQTKGYSRTRYPIYQRSWGMNHGNVYVKENDIRANKYSANLNYSTVTTNLIEWGHTFNDVQVPYHTTEKTLSNNLAGFSIRAHKKDQTNKALIRLPKADTSYEYYDWTDTNSDPAAGTGVKAVSKPDYEYKLDDGSGNNEVTLFTVPSAYRLVTDEHQRDGDLEYSVSAMQQNSDYILVGNPYMVSIDMNKFFATNTTLDQTGYWTYEVTEENNVVSGEMKAYVKPTQTNTNLIKPMQAFFVKKGTAEKITFNRDMQVDGNFPPPASGTSGTRAAEAAALTLRAVNEEGSSSAQVKIWEKASEDYVGGEDVETLFDSNLSDVPMVYTVAGNKAVSIDTRPEVDIVPFGVTCALSDGPVEVNVDSSLFTLHSSLLYIIDAVTGEVTEVTDGQTVSVQPNDYGRYFLTTRGDLTAIREAMAQKDIVVSVRGMQVAVRSASELESVRILTVGGETVQAVSDCGTEVVFNLVDGGVYIIEAQTENDRKTMKVIVK